MVKQLMTIHLKRGSVVRSKLSSWVHRAFYTLVLLASFSSGKFAYNSLFEASPDLSWGAGNDAIWIVALCVALNTPALLFLIALALILRSGASVWLAGWLFFSEAAPLVGSIFVNSGGGFLLLAVAAILGLLCTCVFVFLIKFDEIRKP